MVPNSAEHRIGRDHDTFQTGVKHLECSGVSIGEQAHPIHGFGRLPDDFRLLARNRRIVCSPSGNDRLTPSKLVDEFALIGDCAVVDFLGVNHGQKLFPQVAQDMRISWIGGDVAQFLGIGLQIIKFGIIAASVMQVLVAEVAQHVDA